MSFRIKEVLIKLEGGLLGKEEMTMFYPQCMIKRAKTTGHLWWKKITMEEVWYSFYRDTATHVLFTQEYDRTKLVSFSSNEHKNPKEKAQEVIDEYKAELRRSSREFWTKQAVNFHDDNQVVKIHPTK
jgi:hypothetical protein